MWPRNHPPLAGHLSVTYGCKVVPPLELLAADHLQKLNRGAIRTLRTSPVYAIGDEDH